MFNNGGSSSSSSSGGGIVERLIAGAKVSMLRMKIRVMNVSNNDDSKNGGNNNGNDNVFSKNILG